MIPHEYQNALYNSFENGRVINVLERYLNRSPYIYRSSFIYFQLYVNFCNSFIILVLFVQLFPVSFIMKVSLLFLIDSQHAVTKN